MLNVLGIDSRLQLAITISVVMLIVVATLGSGGQGPLEFLLYQTLLIAITILCTIGCRGADLRISPLFLVLAAILFSLMLLSVLRIAGSHSEAFYLWYRYAFFACMFLSLAHYAMYQSPRWKTLLLGLIVAVGSAYLLWDVVMIHGDRIVGFSRFNGDYFATFLLIGLAATLAGAIFGMDLKWRLLSGLAAATIFLGLIRTASRGAALASIAIFIAAAIRARESVPRRVWLWITLAGLVVAIAFSPSLISKFLDRNQNDPYNYARISIWKSSLEVIAQRPILGTGFGQFIHVSRRFMHPVQGPVARYLKQIGMAHSEYLQNMAELGIPAAFLLFFLLGYSIYLVWKRADTAWPESRWLHEAAIFTATGVGVHGLVDNCWTIPVTAASLIVIALAAPLPVCQRSAPREWRPLTYVLAAGVIGIIYIQAVLIPGVGLYYNERGHQAYLVDDFQNAERFHLKAVNTVPTHPVFLDNLGMVYLQQFAQTHEPRLLQLARTYFGRAIQANPQSLDSHLHMENVLMQSFSGDPTHDMDVHRAILTNDTKLLELDPYLPFARKNLASAYHSLGQYDRALQELSRAIEYEPNYVPAYLALSSWYAERGDTEKSQRYEAVGLGIVNKYRNFKPTEVYERYLLGRPDPQK